MRTVAKIGLVGILAILPWLAQASDGQDGNNRKVDFIGVFHPIPTSLSIDPVRCPHASHPLLITFQGEAFTTLGHATLEQSHCEALDHSSFRRGQETITFDNGDQLFGTYSGLLFLTPTTATDRRLVIDGIYRNLGGTGRLKDAHGRGISAGIVHIDTGRAEITVSGTL